MKPNKHTQMSRILIIEDEPKVAESLLLGLRELDYQVDWAASGEEGLTCVLENEPDVIILDLNLPGRDGLEILATLRKHHEQLPVLILSARDAVEDKVKGLERGADDYMIKPFAFPELVARLKVMLRREQQTPVLTFELADLCLDVMSREVSRAGKRINLTPREFEVLELLFRNLKRPVSRKTIARDVWKVERATPLDNVIDVHVMRLRKKIDDGFDKNLIQTIRGLGFMLSDAEQE